MGQSLSCVAKQKEKQPNDDLSKRPGKILFKKHKKELAVHEEVRPKKTHLSEGSATTPSSINQINHIASEPEADTVRRRPKLVLCQPAPPGTKLPTPVPIQSTAKVTPVLDKSQFAAQTTFTTRSSPGTTIYNPQTVDQVARSLAQGDARPATWADLYWTLIESRGFQTDSDKIKALFSWLCSIPMDRDAFVGREELEQGVKDGVPYAEEALRAKSKSVSSDSPEVAVNELTRGKLTYLRAFESLCRYASIPCRTIKGLAKGVDYTVGMRLTNQRLPPESTDTSQISKIQHAWSAAYVDGRWCLFDSMWAAERLAMSANARLSQMIDIGRMEYETDMFYFNADPAIFIHSHYPFEDEWQLLDPPLTLEQFQDGVLLKPAFFTHGLGLFSHQEGVIPVQSKLILKLSIPPSLIKVLLFTFNLKLDGQDELIKGINLSRFGMHEISVDDALVTFSFRFPKSGAYKLTIYARKVGDPLFTDVCEYRVEAKGAATTATTTEAAANEPAEGSIDIPPFPPTSQPSYGPTEKASELQLQLVPSSTSAVVKCSSGVFEVRFAMVDPSLKLPQMLTRLKSLLYDSAMLTDCSLVRTVEASTAVTTMTSITSEGSTATGHWAFPTCLITTYLPAAGEYALEVYAAPADAEKDTSYFLVWQFLIDADCATHVATPVRQRLVKTKLGPHDTAWTQLGLQTVSHRDPLIHVPTKTAAGFAAKVRSKSELMQQFARQPDDTGRLSLNEGGGGSGGAGAGDRLDASPVGAQDAQSEAGGSSRVDEQMGPRSCDLKIVLKKPATDKLCIVGELVDISEPEEVSQPGYLLQQLDEADEATINAQGAMEQISYLIRIPHGDHFYKFHLYAAMVDTGPAIELPLVYTYVIEAPARLMASEVPYIGVEHGPFPEKLEQHQKQQQQQERQQQQQQRPIKT